MLTLGWVSSEIFNTKKPVTVITNIYTLYTLYTLLIGTHYVQYFYISNKNIEIYHELFLYSVEDLNTIIKDRKYTRKKIIIMYTHLDYMTLHLF